MTRLHAKRPLLVELRVINGPFEGGCRLQSGAGAWLACNTSPAYVPRDCRLSRCRYEISIFPFGSNGRPHATPAGARARPARPLRERGCPRKEAEAFEGGATQVLRPTPAPPSRSDSSAGSHCASGTRGHGGNAPVPISPAGGPGDHPGHISHWVLPNGGNEIRQLALPYHPPLVGRKLPNGFWKVPSSRRRSSFQSASSRMSV